MRIAAVVTFCLLLFGPFSLVHAQGAGDGGITKAIALLYPTQGNAAVKGIVTFTKTEGGVRVVADLEGLTPGPHGFHVHQYGDCSAPNADSAGGHFNPQNKLHGGPVSRERHVGDLGNLTADSNGKAHLEWTDALVTFEGADSVIGRGFIVHAGPDDLTSQPAGNAGPRVACGVFGIAAK